MMEAQKTKRLAIEERYVPYMVDTFFTSEAKKEEQERLVTKVVDIDNGFVHFEFFFYDFDAFHRLIVFYRKLKIAASKRSEVPEMKKRLQEMVTMYNRGCMPKHEEVKIGQRIKVMREELALLDSIF